MQKSVDVNASPGESLNLFYFWNSLKYIFSFRFMSMVPKLKENAQIEYRRTTSKIETTEDFLFKLKQSFPLKMLFIVQNNAFVV